MTGQGPQHASGSPARDLIRYAGPIASGLLILAISLLPWLWLSRVNLRVRPDLPWSALVTVAYLGMLLLWLAGWGPPARTAHARARRLRLWPPHTPRGDGVSAGVVVMALGLVYVAWTAISAMSPPPDLSEFPTTAVRWSMFLMGGLTAGVVEEVAFRGYMQTGLERHDPDSAIWITSVVFVLSHMTQGLGAVVALGQACSSRPRSTACSRGGRARFCPASCSTSPATWHACTSASCTAMRASFSQADRLP